ncbi:MAG: DUF3500 domain-containing protein [Candidatus Hydrogenedentota bacterium]
MRVFLAFIVASTIVFVGLLQTRAAVSEGETPALMAAAAKNFVAALSTEQRAACVFALDAEQRLEFRTAPFPLTGLRQAEMRADQQELFHALLSASLSAKGYEKGKGIIELDDFLVETNLARGGRANNMHGTDKYSLAIFGDPTPDGTWAWRIHGHHLAISFTVSQGKLYVAAPSFFGAEPHVISEGPRAGLHILRNEDLIARKLMESLNAELRAKAIIADEMPRDMFSGDKRQIEFDGPPEGIAFSALDANQRKALRDLVEEYVSTVPPDVQWSRRDKVEKGGWENVYFAWIGATTPGERNYYRVQGPEFLIEYCAVALTPNHVHTIWRDRSGDFGRDLLAEHYNSIPHE